MRYILILFLILVNGIFSCVEIAIVSMNKSKLKLLVDKGDKRAILLSKTLEDPSIILSVIQVSVTVSGFLASAFSAIGISSSLINFLSKFNIYINNEVAIVIITIILSYMTLVFGELVPKRIGLIFSEKIALNAIYFITFLKILLAPFIFILTKSTNLVLKIFRINDNDVEKITKEEISSMLELNTSDIININEIDIMKRVISFDEKSAREIMKPRTSIFAVDINENIVKLLQNEEFVKYSRIPVYEEDLDNILGILHVKEILRTSFKNGFENVDIKSLIQEAYFVPESISINNLFKNMKTNNKHMTILVDEHGGISGMVTLEDLLEELVGNISDEFDIDDDKRIVKLSSNKYLIDCEISLNDLNEVLNINLESNYYDSLNGFLIEHLGFIPHENQQIPDIYFENILFKFHKVTKNKIDKVIIELKGENEDDK